MHLLLLFGFWLFATLSSAYKVQLTVDSELVQREYSFPETVVHPAFEIKLKSQPPVNDCALVLSFASYLRPSHDKNNVYIKGLNSETCVFMPTQIVVSTAVYTPSWLSLHESKVCVKIVKC